MARVATQDGTSINQFVMTAVTEKLAALEMAARFTERRRRADVKAFRRIMTRPGGAPPRPGDESERANDRIHEREPWDGEKSPGAASPRVRSRR